jgi:hypothetical protein
MELSKKPASMGESPLSSPSHDLPQVFAPVGANAILANFIPLIGQGFSQQ